MKICFDFQNKTALYLQLRNQIIIAISKGELKALDKLPSVRRLADESGVNTMTISKAYQLLKNEGYITTDRRGGAVVVERKINTPSPELLDKLKLCISELKALGLENEEIQRICNKELEETI